MLKDMKVDGAGSLGSATTINKMEEMPFTGANRGFTVPDSSSNIPQTDNSGMKIMGHSDNKGPDINNKMKI